MEQVVSNLTRGGRTSARAGGGFRGAQCRIAMSGLSMSSIRRRSCGGCRWNAKIRVEATQN